MDIDERDVPLIRDLCDFAIARQEGGHFVPGHAPRSGVFADCSMACTDSCLSLRAKRLRARLREPQKLQNNEDLEMLLASRICAARRNAEPEKDFRKHFEGCAWCKKYIRQRQEAKKYSTGNSPE